MLFIDFDYPHSFGVVKLVRARLYHPQPASSYSISHLKYVRERGASLIEL